MSILAKSAIRPCFLALILGLTPVWGLAHDGGVDQYGCHGDYKGREHCH